MKLKDYIVAFVLIISIVFGLIFAVRAFSYVTTQWFCDGCDKEFEGLRKVVITIDVDKKYKYIEREWCGDCVDKFVDNLQEFKIFASSDTWFNFREKYEQIEPSIHFTPTSIDENGVPVYEDAE